MFCESKRVAERHGKYQKVAVGGTTQLYCILDDYHDCAPAIKHKEPTSVLRPDDWQAVTKKYRLSNASIKRLKEFWALGGSSFVSDNNREMWAFGALEDLMVKRMKRFYKARRGTRLLPYMDWKPGNESVNNHLICSNSGAGKTYFANKLLTTLDSEGKNYAQGRPIVALTRHSKDPSFQEARRLYKKKWVDIDLEKLQGAPRLSIDMLEPGSLVIADDVLETNNALSRTIFDFLNRIVTVGRHHKASNGRGVECIIITHRGTARELQTIRHGCRFLTLFPNQRTQCTHILKSRLDMTKAQIGRLLDRCGDSRTITFDLWYPAKALSSRHCELLS